jgi:hypothetical protein
VELIEKEKKKKREMFELLRGLNPFHFIQVIYTFIVVLFSIIRSHAFREYKKENI